MNRIEVYVPVAEPRIAARSLAARLGGLAGKRIGWLDNLKANAGALLNEVAAAWRADGHDFAVVRASKEATAAAPDAVMAHLQTCHAVVLAISD